MGDAFECGFDRRLQLAGRWKPLLGQAGLDSFDALMQGEEVLRSRVADCLCLSRHKRGQTFRLTFHDGQVLYLKRDCFTPAQHVLFQMVRLRAPQPLAIRELQNIRRVSALGLRVAPVAAWGQRRRLGLPSQAILVTAPLEGTSLDLYVSRESDSLRRRDELKAVGAAVARLHGDSLIWRDLVPRHIFIAPGQSVGMLDMERMRPACLPVGRRCEKHIKRFCKLLRRAGADDADVDAFLASLREGREEN
jgi:hypothetical protein